MGKDDVRDASDHATDGTGHGRGHGYRSKRDAGDLCDKVQEHRIGERSDMSNEEPIEMATDAVDLRDLSKAALRDPASPREARGRDGMTKDELIDAMDDSAEDDILD